MIRRERVLSHENPKFEFCWDLYISSFPEKECRSLDYQIEAMEDVLYNCDIIMDGEQAVGFIFWWDFDEVIFIDHFATSPEMRGRGYGSDIMDDMIATYHKPILLEVESPIDETTRRRVTFYERIGFSLNDHTYHYPSYRQATHEFVKLQVMTHPRAITKEELENFCITKFPTIHFRNYGGEVVNRRRSEGV